MGQVGSLPDGSELKEPDEKVSPSTLVNANFGLVFVKPHAHKPDCIEFVKDELSKKVKILGGCSIGADAILLIAELLPPERIAALAKLARELDLEVLMETHSAEGLDKLCDDVTLCGINTRNLKTFAIHLEVAEELVDRIPAGLAKVVESGMRTPEDVHRLRRAGFEGFLIGSQFMRQPHPGQACRQFIRKLAEHGL